MVGSNQQHVIDVLAFTYGFLRKYDMVRSTAADSARVPFVLLNFNLCLKYYKEGLK